MKLFLLNTGPQKLRIYKTVKQHTGLGLKDIKYLVDKASEESPQEILVLDSLNSIQIHNFANELNMYGATTIIKP